MRRNKRYGKLNQTTNALYEIRNRYGKGAAGGSYRGNGYDSANPTVRAAQRCLGEVFDIARSRPTESNIQTLCRLLILEEFKEVLPILLEDVKKDFPGEYETVSKYLVLA